MTSNLAYVLVTAARNEEALIGSTIEAVVAQTMRPIRWIIVSDGSTDLTDEIVTAAATRYQWIELVRLPERRERDFAGKAHAVGAGFQRLAGLDYDIIGILDADITFDPDYFAFLLDQFTADPDLGVAGTPYFEDATRPDRHAYSHEGANLEHVSGGCQLFRRCCFEEVGGYKPIKGGAIDWIAVTTARMKGWKTRTFTQKSFLHHRQIGTADSGVLKARFHYGRKAYYVGGHPAWELLRGINHMRSRPYVAAGTCFIAGYLWAAMVRTPRPVPAELIAFHRREQLGRLRRLLGLA